MKRAAVIIGLLSASTASGFSAPPKLDTVWPPGAKLGSAVEITLEGKFDPWPCEVNFSKPGFNFVPDPEKSGAGKLDISAEVSPGPVLVRAINEDGASAPVIFVVDDRTEIEEKEEDKNTLAGAQEIDLQALPLVINGRLSGTNELDAFRLALKKGEAVHAAVEGYTLRSLVDPALHLYDEEGNRLVLEHDSEVHLDPRLSFTAPANGNYVLSLAGFAHPPATAVSYRGSKTTRYRLHLAREQKELPARLLPADIGPDSKDPTLAAGKPKIGTLSKPGEIGRHSIKAKKGQQFLVSVEAASLGFPTDAVLRVLKPDGSELRTVDDANKQRDPEYLWKVAADGDYEIAVTDRFGRGGPNLRYRVGLAEPEPAFSATVDKSEYVLERGKPLEIKVKIGRLRGHKADLGFAIPDLPESIQITTPDEVPEKGGEVTLKLEAKEKAEPFSQSVAIRVTEKAAGDSAADDSAAGKKVDAVFSFQDGDSRGPYAIDETSDIWLTLPPEEKAEEKAADPEKSKEKS
ncbi:MAG: hypothetical protein WD342_03830 [Verrucomicrobiales bacterium]